MTGFAAAVHAEWTKLRTIASPAWLAVTAAVLTAAVGVLVLAAQHCGVRDCSPDGVTLYDIDQLTLSGVQVGQAVVAILAVLAVAGEYSTGTMRTTLSAMPRRGLVLAAKAMVIAGIVLATAAVGVLASVLAGRLMLPGRGFTAAHGYGRLSFLDGTTIRAAGGTVLYLTLIALLAIGVATAVRESAVAIGAVLGLLYLFPVLISVVSNQTWQRHLHQISPSEAGLAIQATVGVRTLPIGPWAGLGVLGLWATGALVLGSIVLWLRDA